MSPAESLGYPKGRATRATIVATAMERFSANGYRMSSIKEIAEACGISRAGLLHHFASKEDLLIEVLKHRESSDRAIFRQSGASEPNGLGVLRGIVNLARHNTSVPGLMRLYVLLAAEAVNPDHPAHAYFRENYRRVLSGTVHALERARDAGLLREGIEPATAAQNLLALQDGLQVTWLMTPEQIDLPGSLERFIEDQLTAPFSVTLRAKSRPSRHAARP